MGVAPLSTEESARALVPEEVGSGNSRMRKICIVALAWKRSGGTSIKVLCRRAPCCAD